MPELNDQMSFGHIVEVTSSGVILDRNDEYAEESVFQRTDNDGQAIGEPQPPNGWTFLTGFSEQDRYRGPTMHRSESIGSGLETHIRGNPGLYVAMSVECDADGSQEQSENVGWVVAFKPTS